MTIFVTILLISQNQIKIPSNWMMLEPKQTPSQKWLDQKTKNAKVVENLKQRKTGELAKHWASVVSRIEHTESPLATDAYECSWYLASFVPKLFNTRDGTFMSRAIWQTKGSDDPEFMRMAYSALSVQRSPGNWGLLGPKLRKIFPNDIQLKKAFVNDGIFGNLPLEYRYQARQILNRDLKDIYSEYAFIDLNSEIENRLYWSTQKKIHLDSAIEYLPKFIKLAKTQNRPTAQAEAILSILLKKKAEGKYID